MAPLNTLSPGNALAVYVYLSKIDPTTGVVSAQTTGTLTGFLSNNPSSTAVTIPTLSVLGVYIGGATAFTDAPGPGIEGSWMFLFPASIITASICTTYFEPPTRANAPYFYCMEADVIRVTYRLVYVQNRLLEPA